MLTQRFTGQKVFHVVVVENLKSSVYDTDIVFKIVGWHLYLSQPVLTVDAIDREPASVHLNQAWNQVLMTASSARSNPTITLGSVGMSARKVLWPGPLAAARTLSRRLSQFDSSGISSLHSLSFTLCSVIIPLIEKPQLTECVWR
jgi:hypothetical protein